MKRVEPKETKWVIGFACVLVIAAYAMVTIMVKASPPVGVRATPIGRATYNPFRVKTDDQPLGGPNALLDYEAMAKTMLDMVVQTHDFAPGASTGTRIQVPFSSASWRDRLRSMKSMIQPAPQELFSPARGMSIPAMDTLVAMKPHRPLRT